MPGKPCKPAGLKRNKQEIQSLKTNVSVTKHTFFRTIRQLHDYLFPNHRATLLHQLPFLHSLAEVVPCSDNRKPAQSCEQHQAPRGSLGSWKRQSQPSLQCSHRGRRSSHVTVWLKLPKTKNSL